MIGSKRETNMANLIYSVEDDINISKIIALTLKKQGYEVLSFSDGSSFLEAFSKRKPDLVLLDLMLPDIDGFDILLECSKLSIAVDLEPDTSFCALFDLRLDGFDGNSLVIARGLSHADSENHRTIAGTLLAATGEYSRKRKHCNQQQCEESLHPFLLYIASATADPFCFKEHLLS